MKENIKQVLKEELNNIINQNKQEVLTFEVNPLEFIIQKYQYFIWEYTMV